MGDEWRTVGIVGVGLIGGSFALALRKAGFTGKIIGVSSPATIKAALGRGVVDQALPLQEAAAQADAIFLAQPIEKILETIDVIDSAVRPGTLLTDAGSTKRTIVERAAQKIKRGHFVGGHPMAGKEASGVEAADADLFVGRPWVLTDAELVSNPSSRHASAAVLKTWIAKFGARLVHLDAAEHDRLVALVSHVPQLMSTALASLIAGVPEAARVAGPASIDFTRLALSSYDIWRDIFATNAQEIERALDAYIARLELLRADLRGAKMQQVFEQAANGARAVRRD